MLRGELPRGGFGNGGFLALPSELWEIGLGGDGGSAIFRPQEHLGGMLAVAQECLYREAAARTGKLANIARGEGNRMETRFLHLHGRVRCAEMLLRYLLHMTAAASAHMVQVTFGFARAFLTACLAATLAPMSSR